MTIRSALGGVVQAVVTKAAASPFVWNELAHHGADFYALAETVHKAAGRSPPSGRRCGAFPDVTVMAGPSMAVAGRVAVRCQRSHSASLWPENRYLALFGATPRTQEGLSAALEAGGCAFPQPRTCSR